MTKVWSQYQNNIFDWVEQSTGHGNIIAVAGSGKTTTGEEAVKRISCMENVLYCAFTNAIADEAKLRFSLPNVKVSTLNSLGWAACFNAMRGKKLVLQKEKKTEIILTHKVFPNASDADFKWMNKYKHSIARLISLFKGACCYDLESADKLLPELLEFHDIDVPEKLVEFVRFQDVLMQTFKHSISTTMFYDYDDQIYQPLKNDWDLRKYDWVFVDEYQDFNLMKDQIACRSVRNGGRMVIMGDPDQAIYEFTGAVPDMMATWQAKMDAKELLLSVCYRCPRSVINVVKEIVKHIEPGPNAIEGCVQRIKNSKLTGLIKPGDFVLCRTTAPAVKKCLELIGQGIPAYVKGQDQGLMGLVNMICKDEVLQIADFASKLTAYYMEKADHYKRLGRDAALDALTSKFDVLQVLCENVCYTTDLPNKIEQLFDNERKNSVACMTSHKSKGLQSKNIFVLEPDQLDDDWKATKPWMRGAQRRLRYVTFTRAQETLSLVDDDA